MSRLRPLDLLPPDFSTPPVLRKSRFPSSSPSSSLGRFPRDSLPPPPLFLLRPFSRGCGPPRSSTPPSHETGKKEGRAQKRNGVEGEGEPHSLSGCSRPNARQPRTDRPTDGRTDGESKRGCVQRHRQGRRAGRQPTAKGAQQ